MNTEQVPEVTSTESGLVPPQNQPQQEWPKKIRTLSALELDRLTIDADGRFYWDGKLVNYKPESDTSPAAAAARERAALDMLEQAAQDLTDHKVTTQATATVDTAPVLETPKVEPAPTVQVPHEPTQSLAPEPQVEPRVPSPEPASLSSLVAPSEPVPSTIVAVRADRDPSADVTLSDRPIMSDRKLQLSRAQSFGFFVAVLALILTGLGMAAQGMVAAHEWACKAGVMSTYCPKPPAPPAAPPRPDIPA